MNKKNCTKCKELKPLSEFCKNKNYPDGHQCACKSCTKIYREAYKKTKDGLIANIYSGQRDHSRNREHPAPDYSLEQLRIWVFNQSNFEELYKNWLDSGCDSQLAPSVDRADDYLPYTINNLLRVCTWYENWTRAHSDVKNGINNKRSKAVKQLTMDGEFVAEFYSVRQASRDTKVNCSGICNCCRGTDRYISAGGFKWSYA